MVPLFADFNRIPPLLVREVDMTAIIAPKALDWAEKRFGQAAPV